MASAPPCAGSTFATALGIRYQFHGSTYEFLRNSVLDARNYFDHGGIPGVPGKRVWRLRLASSDPQKSVIIISFSCSQTRRLPADALGLSDLSLVPVIATASRSQSRRSIHR